MVNDLKTNYFEPFFNNFDPAPVSSYQPGGETRSGTDCELQKWKPTHSVLWRSLHAKTGLHHGADANRQPAYRA